MSRRKTTFYLDKDTLKAAKIAAIRSDKREYEIVEEALQAFLGLKTLKEARRRNALDPDEALDLAYRELHAMREERK